MANGLPDVRLIGRRIRLRRSQIGIEQKQLAERAGCSEAYVSRLENGVVPRPKLSSLANIAAALGTTVEQLIYRGPQSPGVEGDTALAGVIGKYPQLSVAFANIANGLDFMNEDDRRFVVDAIELIANRYGLDTPDGV